MVKVIIWRLTFMTFGFIDVYLLTSHNKKTANQIVLLALETALVIYVRC